MSRHYRLAALVVVFAALFAALAWSQDMSGASAIPAGYMAYAGANKLLAVDQQAKTVTVDLVSTGLNFDGYNKGNMIVEVPVGWTVTVDLKVDSGYKHSALIVPWDQRTAADLKPAFTGSEPSDFKAGVGKGDPDEQFTFTADSAGKYALVCGVPGHDALGMWDEFDVSADLDAPQVFVQG